MYLHEVAMDQLGSAQKQLRKNKVGIEEMEDEIWACAKIHHPAVGRGTIVVRLTTSSARIYYMPLAECIIRYPMIVTQVCLYRYPTECVVLLLEDNSTKGRLHIFCRAVFSA
jgi:hypothetical protein